VDALHSEGKMKSRVWLGLITLYIAWGTTYLAIHFAVQTIPPFFMTGTRFLVAGLILYAWRRLAGEPAPTRRQWRSAIIIGLFLLVGGIGGVSLAEKSVPSGITALLVAATPLWVTLIEALRPNGNRPSWQSLAGVLLGMVGIFILVDPFASTAGRTSYSLVGFAMVLLAVLSWAIGSIYSHSAELPKSPLMGSGMELLAGAAGSYVVGLLLGESRQLNFTAISWQSLAGLGYLVVVGSLIGFVAYTWLLRVAPVSQVVTYTYVNPLVAVVVGSLVAGEMLSTSVVIAIPIIIVSLILVNLAQSKPKIARSEPVGLHVSAGDD
jgi:drug/metabolite transporter (DMT)-like permease